LAQNKQALSPNPLKSKRPGPIEGASSNPPGGVMATIRASCANCGDVQLTTGDVTVRMCVSTDEGEYRFECPTCADLVVRHAEQRTIDLLLAAGVSLTTWSLPAEMFESHEGAPISHDDLIDFHSSLQNDDAVAAFFADMI
jgi:predicted RNA-binding Zn-ribbon protein involved in translation (DUF1610 family)